MESDHVALAVGVNDEKKGKYRTKRKSKLKKADSKELGGFWESNGRKRL